MKLQLVRWTDAHFEFSREGNTEEPDGYLVETVGWVEEGSRFLKIVSERTPDDQRAVTFVPRETVEERIDLMENGHVPDIPSTFVQEY